MTCWNWQDGCTKDATHFILGIDGDKRHFCERCYLLIAGEMNRRLSVPKWREAALKAFELNNAVGNYLRSN